MLVEVCANSLESALNAQKAGAHRIELCTELGVGGVTPSYGLLKMVKKSISIPVHVLVRPRSGDFTYSDSEFEIMRRDIAQCVELGFEGIVSGVLHPDATLDKDRTRKLVEASNGLKFTFHRAFDWVKDPFGTLTDLEMLGVDCILSSGQKSSAPEGIDLLSELDQKRTRCVIMPGGGVRGTNAHQFKEKGFEIVHLTGIRFHRTLPTEPLVSMNSPSFLRDDHLGITDPAAIHEIVNGVK